MRTRALRLLLDPGEPGLAAMHATMIPHKRKDCKFLSVVGNDGGTEPDGGAPFRTSLARIPLTVEGSADHFSEACPASGWNPRAKLPYSSRLQQANLYSQNLLTIATPALWRQHGILRRRGFSGPGIKNVKFFSPAMQELQSCCVLPSDGRTKSPFFLFTYQQLGSR
jgi:hypothetical protein